MHPSFTPVQKKRVFSLNPLESIHRTQPPPPTWEVATTVKQNVAKLGTMGRPAKDWHVYTCATSESEIPRLRLKNFQRSTKVMSHLQPAITKCRLLNTCIVKNVTSRVKTMGWTATRSATLQLKIRPPNWQ